MLHTPLELFFQSTSRSARPTFIMAIAVLAGLWSLTLWLDVLGAVSLASWVAKAVLAYSGLCVLSLRLHDCGRSGWWSWIIMAMMVTGSHWRHETPGLGLLALGCLCLLTLAVCRGQRHFNRYGAVPSL